MSVINDTIILEHRKAQISNVLIRIAAIALRIFLESGFSQMREHAQ